MKLYKLINVYRLVPRLASVLFGYTYYQSLQWYLLLDTQTIEQTTFITGFTACIVGWFKFYMSGNKTNEDTQ